MLFSSLKQMAHSHTDHISRKWRETFISVWSYFHTLEKRRKTEKKFPLEQRFQFFFYPKKSV